MDDRGPRVVIVGGGFGGLAAAKALSKTPAVSFLIDRTNHHLFQPLLYQVATAVLTPGQIASPIRAILRKQRNATVILGEVTGVDVSTATSWSARPTGRDVPIYDYLILATGASHSYFGHDEFEKLAPGLKSLADAVAVRNKILRAFEQAEAEEDPEPSPRPADLCAGRGRPHRRRDGRRARGAGAHHAPVGVQADRSRVGSNHSGRSVAPRVLGTFAEGLSGPRRNGSSAWVWR